MAKNSDIYAYIVSMRALIVSLQLTYDYNHFYNNKMSNWYGEEKKTIQIAIELLFDLNEMITLILCMRW